MTIKSTNVQIELVYYTDPLCCWSWAMQSSIAAFQRDHQPAVHIRYCMAGLLPGWKQYHDELNSVSKPIQMGPVWMHAMQVSGVPIRHDIWFKDPPASSYLACIAVKCAAMQGPEAEARMLYMIQHAILHEGQNITRQRGLVSIAAKLAEEMRFDADQFQRHLLDGTGNEAFRKDLQEVQALPISRIPSLLIRKTASRKGLLLKGYQTAEKIAAAVTQVMAEDVEKTKVP